MLVLTPTTTTTERPRKNSKIVALREQNNQTISPHPKCLFSISNIILLAVNIQQQKKIQIEPKIIRIKLARCCDYYRIKLKICFCLQIPNQIP